MGWGRNTETDERRPADRGTTRVTTKSDGEGGRGRESLPMTFKRERDGREGKDQTVDLSKKIFEK